LLSNDRNQITWISRSLLTKVPVKSQAKINEAAAKRSAISLEATAKLHHLGYAQLATKAAEQASDRQGASLASVALSTVKELVVTALKTNRDAPTETNARTDRNDARKTAPEEESAAPQFAI
jgi:hypothetical protein